MEITVSKYMNFQDISANVVKYFNSIYIQRENYLSKCITYNYNESIDNNVTMMYCFQELIKLIKLKFIEYLQLPFIYLPFITYLHLK